MIKLRLRAFMQDVLIISGIIIISLYFPDYRWFVNLFIILLSVLGILTYAIGFHDSEVESLFYKAYDKRNYNSLSWKIYDVITDLISLGCIIYFQYKTAAAFIMILFVFGYAFKNKYYNKQKVKA